MNATVKVEGGRAVELNVARAMANSAANALVLGPAPGELGALERSGLQYQPFFMRGTAHLLKYKERYFVVFSRHQVLSAGDELLGHPWVLVSENSDFMLTSPVFKSSPIDTEEPIEHADIAAIELSHSEVAKHGGFQDRFFQLGESFRPPSADTSDKWMLVGFPHKGDVFDDKTDPPTFKRSFVELFGEPALEDRSSPKEICDLVLFPRLEGGKVLEGEFDGLSGSPVFAWSAINSELWYRGMVITGGSDRVRLIRELCIRRFLDAVIVGHIETQTLNQRHGVAR